MSFQIEELPHILAFDEVKVKEGIVYDSNTGKLIRVCHAN